MDNTRIVEMTKNLQICKKVNASRRGIPLSTFELALVVWFVLDRSHAVTLHRPNPCFFHFPL